MAVSDLTKEAIEIFLKHLTDRVALALLFLCAVLLASMAIPGASGDWARTHTTWVAFGILGPLCYLPTRFVFEKIADWQADSKRKDRLHNLTGREKTILAPYVHNDFRTRRIPHSDAVARGLADDGVLYRPDVPRDQAGCEAYNIQEWARKYLKDNNHLVGKPDDALGAVPGDA
jgi:hypothetical protein